MKEILRSLRNENNYSQSAVANYLEISRQMYNKYETGIAEPSLKNIKKLCDLYKVSADVFLNNLKSDTKESTTYTSDSSSSTVMEVASPTVHYGESLEQKTSSNLLTEISQLIPLLHFSEQISLLSRLVSIIEQQSHTNNQPVLKTKKIKKIPDAEYNSYLYSEEATKIRNASLANIREILKNDEW